MRESVAEKIALKERARAVPIYGVGEIPADRLDRDMDVPGGSGEVLKLFFRSWPFIRPYFLGYWWYPEKGAERRDVYAPLLRRNLNLWRFSDKGSDKDVADLVSDGEYNFQYCAVLSLLLAIAIPFFGLIPPMEPLAEWMFYVPLVGVVVANFAMAIFKGFAQLVFTIVLIFCLLGTAISAVFFVDGWQDNIWAGVFVAISLIGWSVQFRVNEQRKFMFRVRAKTHLVYFYIVSFIQRILGTGFALLNADLLNQALLQGEPLAPGLSAFLGFPELSSDYLESLTQAQQMDLLYHWVVINLGYFFAMLPINVAMGYYNMWIMQMINQNLREALVERWHQLSITYHSDHRTGDSIFRIYQDSAMVTNVIRMLIDITLRIMSYFSTVAIIFLLSPLIGTIAGLIVIPGFLFGRYAMPKVRSRSLAYRAAASDVTATVQETFSSIRVIKAFNAGKQVQEKMEHDSLISFNAAYRIRNLIAAVTILMFTLMAAVMISGEFTMAFWARSELSTWGEELIKLVGVTFVVWNLASFNYARGEFRGSANSLRWLLRNWMTCQDMAMGLKRVFDILDIEPDIKDSPDAVPMTEFRNDIKFENINFQYVEGRPVLDDVSFTAKAGTITAIIGPTGSGKSSLMALLLRMFDPKSGRILVDDRDIKEFQVNSLRSSISIALQENVLFALSVRDNIRYVAPWASEEQLSEAIRVAAMDDYVDGLPEGVDTILSDRGGKISSGQKQRLSIARAVIRDTPILVLDEPTAALDAATELRVLSNLAEWGEGRAIFLITHRISTIRRADNILYLDEGRILESGNHDELMAIEGGAYRSFVEAEMNLTDTSRQLST